MVAEQLGRAPVVDVGGLGGWVGGWVGQAVGFAASEAQSIIIVQCKQPSLIQSANQTSKS